MTMPEPGNIEFGRKKPVDATDSKTDPSKTKEPEFHREHFSEIGQKVGEGGPKSAPADRQTDELLEFERAQQPVTNHQDRRHK